jgi:hypothetical protein
MMAIAKEARMSTGSDDGTELKFVVTNTLIVRDVPRSVAFYQDVLARGNRRFFGSVTSG